MAATVAVSVHPQTTQVVGTGSVLVGYVAVRLQQPTEITGIDVAFGGWQRVEWRQGSGPSGSQRSVRRRCGSAGQRLITRPSKLSRGEHRLGFAVELPAGLPASAAHGAVAYALTATVRRPGLRCAVHARPTPIRVVRGADLPPPSYGASARDVVLASAKAEAPPPPAYSRIYHVVTPVN
ncbi:hypothetical protein GGI04_002291 [Coemansia thaxteri]|nr:hypothetical protein GGI04_002291 [Coemansia thaxteri]